MSKSEIDRSVAWLSGVAAAFVVAGCATTSPVTPTDTLAAAASSASAAQPAAAPPGDAAQHPEHAAAPAPIATRYVVRRGDTLSAIAQANGCTVRELQAWNRMGRRTRIGIGQVLRIAPPGAENAVASEAADGAGATRAAGNAAGAARAADPASGAGGAPVADAPQPASAPESAADRAADHRVVQETKRHAQSIALAWPAKGAVVETFQPGRNRGIRILGRAGDPVRAAASGRVMYAGTGLNGYGTLILVQHNADFLTAYAHNRKVLVKTGDVVQQGEQIAEMGTGDSTRAGMLFEVRRDGKPVNPMPYLASRQQG
ncbi:M23 family metallopeptidase [Burkholderia pseudomallei]|uniref:M23 family metallopeptidase n=1 Tax=Burkholderia pseudomallei TaxID=28450 RepID=UPI00052AB96C|nr:M23 family metallopeptidase [Burkholderia pseudomallei]AIV87389.1 lysM domain protein [Burkholderia pseudomallei B03]AIV93803.1 lysM domain protein [Burkholderia pseudomallei A79A]KGY00929.1 lysM domain protein [Burkholderia pseudomallei A79D]KGY01994.1 lysM domain protein [Burkholderia pseudomallei A79C]